MDRIGLDGLIFTEDVQIDDVSASLAVLQLFGSVAPPGDAALVIADLVYGLPSHAVYVAATELAPLVAGLSPAPLEAGLDALDVVRVEAGVPRFLVDMTEDTIPLEAGLEDRAISFTKGCYVGQEIIVRVTTRGGGRVARKLVGLRFDPDRLPPEAGATLHAGDRGVGKVTSAVYSPRCAGVIGLGYVHRDFVEPGTTLEVHAHEHRHPVTVHALPFVPPRS